MDNKVITVPELSGLDEEQWYSALIDRYTPYVTAIVGGMAKGSLAAGDLEEVAADVFFRVWLKRDNIRPGGLKGYIAQTARNATIDKLRTLRVEIVPYDDDILQISCPERPDELAIVREQTQIMEAAVKALGEPDREIFIRFYYFGETVRAIADKLLLNVSTTKTKLHRSRAKLRETMLERGYGCE